MTAGLRSKIKNGVIPMRKILTFLINLSILLLNRYAFKITNAGAFVSSSIVIDLKKIETYEIPS
jgi:hypothetical protein